MGMATTEKWESRDDNSDDDNGKTLVPAIFFSRCSWYFRYELPPTSAVEVYVRRRQAEDRHFGFQYQGSIEESISVPVATLKPLRGQILSSVTGPKP
jgi:hypothetical protein